MQTERTHRLKLQTKTPRLKLKTNRSKRNSNSKCVKIQIGIQSLDDLIASTDIKQHKYTQSQFNCAKRVHCQEQQRYWKYQKCEKSNEKQNEDDNIDQIIQKQKLDLSLLFQEPTKKWSINDFQILRVMGKGKFGTVLAAKDKATQYCVALKRMKKKDLYDHNFVDRIKQEINIQTSIKHPNIVRLYGYFWDDEHIYIILEYAHGGQLLNYIKSSRLHEKNISTIVREVCQGLSRLHQMSIIHRDIKPENILVTQETVKIADFGWSVKSQGRRQTLCGTLDYLAPEIVSGSTHDYTIDIWQIGILTYEMAVGHPPFETSTFDETYRRILKGKIFFPMHVSAQLREFIQMILQKQKTKRPSLSQILCHSFIKRYENLKHNLI